VAAIDARRHPYVHRDSWWFVDSNALSIIDHIRHSNNLPCMEQVAGGPRSGRTRASAALRVAFELVAGTQAGSPIRIRVMIARMRK